MKHNNCPCYLLGLDLTSKLGVLMVVIPIVSSSYNQINKVQPSALEPFTLESTKRTADERAFYFSLALIDFCDWEIQTKFGVSANAEVIDGIVLWYYYPSFIYRFLEHSPTWGSWRKQVTYSESYSIALFCAWMHTCLHYLKVLFS